MKFVTAYGEKVRQKLHFTGPGRTKQSFKDDCDVNTIINRFLKTGVMDFTNKNEPRYGDTTGLDFTTAMQTVATAKALFMEVPPHVRQRFSNDPAQFLDFVNNPANRAEAEKLGLLKPKPQGPTFVPATSASPAATPPAPATPPAAPAAA